MKQVQETDKDRVNYGLNKRILNKSTQVNYELDVILQALNIVPDDFEHSLIQYKNPQKLTNLFNQNLIVDSLLHIEPSSE